MFCSMQKLLCYTTTELSSVNFDLNPHKTRGYCDPKEKQNN